MNKSEFDRYLKSSNEDRTFIETRVWYPNNNEIRSIIMEKSHLLSELPNEFLKLLTHNNVWLSEYELTYIKNSKKPPVFAGTKGYEYPRDVDNFIINEAKKLRMILN